MEVGWMEGEEQAGGLATAVHRLVPPTGKSFAEWFGAAWRSPIARPAGFIQFVPLLLAGVVVHQGAVATVVLGAPAAGRRRAGHDETQQRFATGQAGSSRSRCGQWQHCASSRLEGQQHRAQARVHTCPLSASAAVGTHLNSSYGQKPHRWYLQMSGSLNLRSCLQVSAVKAHRAGRRVRN